MASSLELIWAVVGLILTIGSTLLNAFIVSPQTFWGDSGFHVYSLGVTFQVGAVLLAACAGGKNAGALSQIAYLALGLTGIPIFGHGGGATYIYKPTFGYLLGFVPGAWLCGWLAFRAAPRIEVLAFSCICGLVVIHAVGVLYLGLSYLLGWVSQEALPFTDAVLRFTLASLPGHLAVACAAALVALAFRRLMFY